MEFVEFIELRVYRVPPILYFMIKLLGKLLRNLSFTQTNKTN